MNQNPAAVEKVETESSLLGEQKKKKKQQRKTHCTDLRCSSKLDKITHLRRGPAKSISVLF